MQLVHKVPGEEITMELKMLKLMVFEERHSFTIMDINGTIETVNKADPESDDLINCSCRKLNRNNTEEEEELMRLNKRLAAKCIIRMARKEMLQYQKFKAIS